MSHQLPDVQASQPDVTVGLSQVGVTGVEKLVKIARDGKRPLVLMAEFEVFVDLPGGRKGVDMTRNMEVIDETLETAARGAVGSRMSCSDAADLLLEKHEHDEGGGSDGSGVRHPRVHAGVRNATQSTADIIASATATDDGTSEEIGARVAGMTVCPARRACPPPAPATYYRTSPSTTTPSRSSSTRSPSRGTPSAATPRSPSRPTARRRST